MKKMYKAMLLVLCAALLVAGSVLGTLAYLKDSKTVTNTFSPSNIKITLTETKGGADKTFKMVPGVAIEKDPLITVEAGSEACWLFVKITEDLGAWTADGKTFANYLTYSVITGKNEWTPLTGVSGVYYRKVAASDADQLFNVLVGNAVNVLDTVTKADMDKLYVAGAEKPTLTFTAYAIQYAGFEENVSAAWTAALAQQ